MEVEDSDGKFRFDLSSACANFIQTAKLPSDHPFFGIRGVGFFIINGIRSYFTVSNFLLMKFHEKQCNLVIMYKAKSFN